MPLNPGSPEWPALALAAACLVSGGLGCGSSDSQSSVMAPDAATDAPGGASEGTQWARVAAAYGRLLAIAGKGATDSRGNEWRPEFEGGPALSAELSRPHFAMADDGGNIFIADKEGHGIRKVTPDGKIVTVAGTSVSAPPDDAPGPATARALANPNGLYVRGDGTLYVLDLDHARVRKVTPAGQMSTLFHVSEGLGTGRGLHVAGDESEAFVSAGTVVKRWTPAGGVEDWATGFVDLGNLALDHDGRLLVSDRGASRVFALSRMPGAPVTRTLLAGNGMAALGRDGAAAVETAFAGVRAVWPAHPADGGGFFLGTHEGCQLWFVDRDGIAHLFLDGARDAHGGEGQPFASPGKKVSELRSVSLDARGDVIVVDDDRGFVRRVERLGAGPGPAPAASLQPLL